ncbi:WD40/YVTN/BNR-like repeat-containing protein [Spirosoma aerophilum]
MKGPHDELVDQTEQPATAVRTAATLVKPPGGKVLERLLLFAEERGLPITEVVEAVAEAKPKRNRSRSTEAVAEAAEIPDVVFNYAQALVDAAVALQPDLGQPAEARVVESLRDPELAGMVQPLSPPTGVGPQWRFLGPSMMTNGQTYGESRVNVSGRVSAIAVDPSNANHILCGAASGGVWESFNRGTSWSPRTDYAATMTVGALAFDPSTPATVYCGTGEGNFYAGLGAGLLRSTNGGSTWTMHATAPFIGQGFYDLIVDPANGNHLLAATTGGIYESADGGAVWTLRRGGRCWDLAMHPAGGASAEVLAACEAGIFRSTNGGQTWASVTLPSAPASFNRLAVAISRTNPAVAYAFGASGDTMFLYRRSTAGGAWTRITTGPAGLSTGQAWYDWFLDIAPDTDAEIYLGAIEAYRGNLSGGTWTWVTISNKTGDDIHPDQHAIAFDPTNANIVYIGNDGGLFVSPNRGTSWTALNNGLGTTEIEYMAQDLGSSRWILAGTQDNGSIRYTGNSVWEHIADGDGGDCAVNNNNPNIVYHSFFRMGAEVSTDKGNTWTWRPNANRDPAVYGQLFYPPMEGRGNTIAQAGESVFISRNNLSTGWTNEIALPGRPVASALYLPTPDNIYVGTTNGRIFRLTWSGTAWSAATELISPRAGASISDLHINPANLNRIWATSTRLGGDRVFRSDDGGSTWVNCTVGLPNLPITAVEVHPGNANRVWVAADVGVYQSFNAGATWTEFANGLPNALAVDLLYHTHARVLRVGMRNRGVWEIPVDGWLTAPICGVQFTGSLNPNQTKRWFTFNWPATWHVIWTVMPTSPLPGAPQLSWKVQVERASAEYVTYWISVTNLTGSTVSFEGRYAILSFY